MTCIQEYVVGVPLMSDWMFPGFVQTVLSPCITIAFYRPFTAAISYIWIFYNNNNEKK